MDGPVEEYWVDEEGNQHRFDDIDDEDRAEAETGAAYHQAQGAASSSSTTASKQPNGTAASSRKRKITRIRPLRSCLSCNRRKIKCDREVPCGPCSKRGEGDACSLVAGLSAAHLTNAAIAERLAQLEARVEDLEAAASSPSPGSAEVAGNVVQGSTAKRSRVALPDNKSSPTFQAERSSSRPDTSVLPQDSATSSESRPGYTGKLIANAAETTYNDALLDQTRGRHPQERPASEVLKVNEEFIAANCETEEAALALESLCRTNSGDVSERSDVTAAGLKSAGGSFSLNSTAVPQVGQERSGAASSMSMGIILNPPLAENSTIPRTVTMSAAERKYRSTILIDPTSGGMTGHRLQRSLDTRLRIFTSPNFPNKALCDHIVWSYFRHLDPLWHVHIGWLFDDEYREFWKLRNDGRHLEVDPAWAALFLMTLALGLQVTELPLPHRFLPHPSATSADVLNLADSYICDVEELLNSVNWTRTPQLRVLQTLALFSAFQTLHSVRDPTTFTINGAAVRIAQALGIHDLGSLESPKALSAMLDDDIAIPTGNQPLKDHFARMLWHTLVVLELVHITRAGIRVPLSFSPYTTELPSNIDDSDLQRLPPSATVGSVKAKPFWQLTSVSSLHLRSLFAKNDKILLDLPADMKATDKYTHVMAIDAELRKWTSITLGERTPQQDYLAYKLSQWQHWSLMADVHGAIIHAHRPYMTRGYSDPRFSFSTKTCLESAKVLCESWQYLRDYLTDQRFWWSSMRYLSAALVIFIDLFIAMDNDCPEEILAQKRSDIPLICEILQERMSSVHSTTSKFATAAFGVVSNLLEAEKAKKATMVSRRNSTDGKAVGEVEPVGRVLKRIAENMSSGASIKAEDSHLSAASTYSTQTQSSLAAGTSAASGSAQRPTDQASFPQSSSAKRSIDLRRASVPITDSGRYVKMPKLSPAQQPNGHQGVPETASSDPHLNLNSASSSSTLHMPSLASGSSSSTPSFAVDGDTSSSRQESFNSTIAGSYPWVPPDTQNANYTYLNNGNFVTVTPLQQTLAQGYQQQLQATPISWDTSTLFHPDPSVLLHSMGFPAARPETVLAYAPSDQPGQGPAPPDQGLQYVTQAQTNTVQTSWYSSSGEQF